MFPSLPLFRRFIAILFFFTTSFAFAQDWSQWRGSNRNGILSNYALPQSWPDSLKSLWKTEVGGGYSSPVVKGENAFIHTRVDELEYVTSLNLTTGKILWRKSNEAPFKKNQYAIKHGKGPFSTPVIHDGKLYTLGVTGVLTCFDSKNGEVIWRKIYSEDYLDSEKFFCGISMSPIIHQQKCIVHVGDDRAGALVAYAIDSGEEIWKWEGDNPGYASPIVSKIDGVEQIVTLTQSKVVGVDIENGKLLWEVPFVSDWRENIPTPVYHQGAVIYSGVGRGTTALKIQRNGKAWKTEQKWHSDDVALYMNSPLLSADLLFGLSHLRKGQFFCLDAASGKTLWKSEGRQGQNASIIKANDYLFCLTTNAELIIAKANVERFEPVKTYTVADSPTWAMPVIWDDRILIKDQSSLILWRFE